MAFGSEADPGARPQYHSHNRQRWNSLTMKTSVLPAAVIVIPVLLIHFLAGDRGLAADCSAPNFIPSGLFSAGNQPVFVAVGDLNGDGKQDLAVVNKFSADVSVLLGRGDG